MVLDDDDAFANAECVRSIFELAGNNSRSAAFWRVQVGAAYVPTKMWLESKGLGMNEMVLPEHNNITTCSFAFTVDMARALAHNIQPYDRQDARNAITVHSLAEHLGVDWTKVLTVCPNGRLYGRTEKQIKEYARKPSTDIAGSLKEGK